MANPAQRSSSALLAAATAALSVLLALAWRPSPAASAAGPMPPIRFRRVPAGSLPPQALVGRSMDAAAADLDADGIQDLVVAKEFGVNVLLLGQGGGRFRAASGQLPQASHDSEEVLAADFDGDEDLDLFFASEDDTVHELYLNDGRARFTDASGRLPLQSVGNAAAALDAEGDGDMDVLLGNAGPNHMLVNDGRGAFSMGTEAFLPGGGQTTQDLGLGDLDGDGDIDLVEGNEDGNRLLLRAAGGRFELAEDGRLPLPAAGEESRRARLADVDGDGDLDVFFANVAFARMRPPQDRLLLNDGAARFTDVTATHLPAEAFSTGDVAFVDLDGDADLDAVIGRVFGGDYALWRNEGDGRFEAAPMADHFSPVPRGDGIAMLLADVSGDGLSDLYLCDYRGVDQLYLAERVPARPRVLLPSLGG